MVDAERLVHLVQVVHPVSRAYHLAEVAAADPDQAVIGLVKEAAGQGQCRIHGIQYVGHVAAPAPGEVVDAVVGQQRPLAAVLAGQPFRIALVEALGPGAGQGIEGGEGILGQVTAAGEQRDDPGERRGGGQRQLLGHRARRHPGAHQIGDLGALVDAPHAGGGGDQLGGDRGHIANGGAAVGVTDEVHLLRPCDGEHLLHLPEQLLAAQLRTLGGGDLRHIDAGAVPGQGLGNAVEIVDPEQLVEAEQSVHQHYGVAGLGIAGPLTQHGQGAQEHQ
ncbi:hypothetical protein D3C78_832510 [compost metagenome]